jgi:hypothetical protein
MPRLTRPTVYVLPALTALPVTIVLAVVSLLVGPTHECEECPGDTGASPAQTDQWLWTMTATAAAVLAAWVVAVVVIAATRRDGPRIRLVALALVVLAALAPVAAGGVAIAVSVHNAAHPDGYRS